MSNSEFDLENASKECLKAVLMAGLTKFLPSLPDLKDLVGTNDIYHYTSVDALFNGILVKEAKSEDEAICLWATQYEYMNDATELQYGERIAREIFTEKYPALIAMEKSCTQPLPFNKDYFLISFSLANDSLPMWSMYGKNGNGIEMVFDSGKVIKKLTYLYPCYYNKKDADAMVSRFYDYLKESKLFTSTIASLARDGYILKHAKQVIKDPAYEYEREVRFIKEFKEGIEYRFANNIIIPYVRQYLPMRALKKIIVGPNLDQQRVCKSIQRYIASLGFTEVEVLPSNVPYRS